MSLASKAKTKDTIVICDTKSDARNDLNVCFSEEVFTEHLYSSTEVHDTADTITDIPITSWTEGRRVVELQHLAEKLKACKSCSLPLQFLSLCQRESYLTTSALKSALWGNCVGVQWSGICVCVCLCVCVCVCDVCACVCVCVCVCV